MSSTDSMLHTKSNNIEIMMKNFIQELFDLLLDRYQEGMEQSIEGSGFVFDYVNALH